MSRHLRAALIFGLAAVSIAGCERRTRSPDGSMSVVTMRQGSTAYINVWIDGPGGRVRLGDVTMVEPTARWTGARQVEICTQQQSSNGSADLRSQVVVGGETVTVSVCDRLRPQPEMAGSAL